MEPSQFATPQGVVRFAARDGRALSGEVFDPPGPAKANVIVHGATAVPRRHYTAFAKHLASRGYRVMTYDYRGVGESAMSDPRYDHATMSDWFEHDAPAAVNLLVRRDPTLPLFAVGHSFGGQIASVLDGAPSPVAIATTGAQRGYWATFPWFVRPKLFVNWFVLIPFVTNALGYVPGSLGLGVDMPSGVIREWATWCKHPQYYFVDHPELEIRMRSFSGKLLAFSVTDDAFAPLANVEWLIANHSRAKREHVRFEPADVGEKSFGHFGFFRRAASETIWPELEGYFDETLGLAERPRAVGRTAGLGLDAPLLTDGEVLSDLAHGRA